MPKLKELYRFIKDWSNLVADASATPTPDPTPASTR